VLQHVEEIKSGVGAVHGVYEIVSVHGLSDAF